MSGGMRCMNASCKRELQPGEGELFAKVLCCPDCALMAKRFMERALADLNSLRVMMIELVRQGLLEGKLQFQPSPTGEVPRGDLLLQLAAVAKSSGWNPTTSSDSSSPDVVTVDGSESSPSTSVVDSK